MVSCKSGAQEAAQTDRLRSLLSSLSNGLYVC